MLRLNGVASSPGLAQFPGCERALPLIRIGDSFFAEGNYRAAAAAYATAAQGGCVAPQLVAAVDDAVMARKPTWLWFGLAAAGAFGIGLLVGRRTKRGR